MDYKGLSYEVDKRRDPDKDDHNRRLGAFKGGWTKAVQGEHYDTVLDELTWDNLGWRMGKLFGETEEDRIEEVFEWCVGQLQETRMAAE